MEKHTYNIIIGLLNLFVAMVLLGCNSTSIGPHYRIAVSQPSDDSWRQTMNDEIRREEMFHNNVSVEILSADNSNEKQQRDLRHFIDEGVDLILVSPNEPEPLVALVAEAKKKGIPVITFDRRMKGDDYTMHIEVDNEALGREVAEYATALYPYGARILEVEGNIHTSAAAGRHKGFAEAIAQHPEMQLVASVDAGWDYETSRRLSDSVFQLHPDIDLVFAHTDGMAINVAETVKERGMKGVKFLGIDGIMNVGIQAVTDSVITATFLYPTYGYLLLRQAIDVLDGKPYERECLLPPVSAVDLRNADILRQQVQMQYEETEKIVKLRDKLNSFLSQYATQQMLLWAAVVIVVFGCVIVIVLYRTIRQDKRHRRALTEKNEQLAAATQAKLMFFTNVSHDLRTPLTLIAEPVEQVYASGILPEQQSQLMAIARKNVKILRRLIDQILDFREYENGKTRLNLSEVSVFPLVMEWAQPFDVIACKRGIKYEINIPSEVNGGDTKMITLAIDTEKMERVVFNIISNAFKYTPDGGTIQVEAHDEGKNFVFSVSDTGQGISHEDQKRIFDRFYRVGTGTAQGSGIGLALTKAFVELHGGTIAVESALAQGSRFTITIPIVHTEASTDLVPVDNFAASYDTACLDEAEEMPSPCSAAEDYPHEASELPLLLAIDDNADILRLVTMLLAGEYTIITASNGRQGFEMATKYVPDVILCDVMMPVMDGLECCRALKEQLATSHIPVLMLTACSLDEQRIEGYDSGADGYMSKPFSAAVLKARLKNLIDNRRRLEVPLASSLPSPSPQPEEPLAPEKTKEAATTPAKTRSDRKVSAPSNHREDKDAKEANEVAISSFAIDSQFFNRVLEIINREYTNPDLNIELIASEVGLSQSQLTRKVKALSTITPVELIKRIRVEKGHQKLMTTDSSISEIAYAVGFSDPNYFTKCHKQIYGETPSELRMKMKVQG